MEVLLNEFYKIFSFVFIVSIIDFIVISCKNINLIVDKPFTLALTFCIRM